jgi:hypothetical protein
VSNHWIIDMNRWFNCIIDPSPDKNYFWMQDRVGKVMMVSVRCMDEVGASPHAVFVSTGITMILSWKWSGKQTKVSSSGECSEKMIYLSTQ